MEMCRYGKHEKTETYERPSGARECKQCRREAVKAYRARCRAALRELRGE